MKNRIALIVPYFGKIPDYFDAFLKSIEGKYFDLFFFSDSAESRVAPNIKWYKSSLEEIKQLIESKLQQVVALNKPYKLCDFRPAFGVVFEDYISAYTFWGSIDLDVCMGNFDKFLSDTVLSNTDIVSGIKEYVSGSFFLVRNNKYCNNLFKKSKDWKNVFATDNYLGFDECGGRFFELLKAGKNLSELKPSVESFTEILFKESPAQLRLLFRNIIIEPKKGITMVNANSVHYNEKEYLMIHYIYYKVRYFFYTNKKMQFPFYINRLGFFKIKPNYFFTALSANFWIAIKKKIQTKLRTTKHI